MAQVNYLDEWTSKDTERMLRHKNEAMTSKENATTGAELLEALLNDHYGKTYRVEREIEYRLEWGIDNGISEELYREARKILEAQSQ